MLAEIERGADAVGGIPSTALKGAGLLPHIRATVKLPMIVMEAHATAAPGRRTVYYQRCLRDVPY